MSYDSWKLATPPYYETDEPEEEDEPELEPLDGTEDYFELGSEPSSAPIMAPLSERCRAQSHSMELEGWYVCSNVLWAAADALEDKL